MEDVNPGGAAVAAFPRRPKQKQPENGQNVKTARREQRRKVNAKRKTPLLPKVTIGSIALLCLLRGGPSARKEKVARNARTHTRGVLSWVRRHCGRRRKI
uniref:(northern house mosquito) hypothetical protein n=1 Tax=Culex pipiens TaxID=7175 RepID=A0A8D8LBY4_CULPI